MTTPRVLVTNDDGIRAPGLQALVEGLLSTQWFDVRVGAPDSERSASSHALSDIVSATLFPDGSAVGLPSSVRAYSTSGFPADAVRLVFGTGGRSTVSNGERKFDAVLDIFGDGWRPDLVLSGMNRGVNAGRALVVSGTVGAAREGALQGAKAVAVSLHSFTVSMRAKEAYQKAVNDLLPILDWVVSEKNWPSGVLLNINFPHPSNGGVPNQMIAVPQGRSIVSYEATPTDDAQTNGNDTPVTKQFKFRWVLTMDRVDPHGTPQNDDFLAVMKNFVTLTPIGCTAKDDVPGAMELLCEWRRQLRHPSLQWSRSN